MGGDPQGLRCEALEPGHRPFIYLVGLSIGILDIVVYSILVLLVLFY